MVEKIKPSDIKKFLLEQIKDEEVHARQRVIALKEFKKYWPEEALSLAESMFYAAEGPARVTAASMLLAIIGSEDQEDFDVEISE